MTDRERYREICLFQRANDPFLGIGIWEETADRWLAEGMQVSSIDNMKEISELLIGNQDRRGWLRPNAAITGMGKKWGAPWIVALDPMYERNIIQEDGEHVIEIDYDGTVAMRRKENDSSIPMIMEYPVKDRKSWNEFKKRLDPFSPGRWPEGWNIMTEQTLGYQPKAELAGQSFEKRDFALGMTVLSLYGNPRNYMGLENLSIAIFENPALVEEMVEWQAYLSYEMIKKVYEAGITLDWAWIWEDMCYKKGPLVSPKWIKEFMVPRYRKIADLLRGNGCVDLICDCDGNVDEILPLFLDAGINGTYPLECAAGMDARKVRKKFGKELIIHGNIDKRKLAQGKKEIDEELAKVKELLKIGGYFPGVDHEVPPDVPYKNIVYLLNEIRKMSDYPETRREIKGVPIPE